MNRSLAAIGACALLAFAPLCAPAANDPVGKVRPTPAPRLDDSVHTGETAAWLRSSTRPGPGKSLPPYFEDVSVHDPSIIRADGHYYIFGSHLAAARSDDLLQWQLIGSGVTADNPLFDNVLSELAETLAWAQSDTLWAADVIRLADGRYYMYYNACKGDSPRSALGLAVADKPEGPYRDLGILLRSGMWGLPSEDGTLYDALVHPNTVDPDAFFDAQGKLWMVYGSYSGGLFILQMDPATGRPLPQQGYGKHLMGGNHARIEGATIDYSPETGWYYLFTSFGGLAADGGYNVRVARSRAPDGPYLDARGIDMASVKADPALPLFDDASIQGYGQKLIGNFVFDRKLGEPGTGSGRGDVSPGHNSVYRDPRDGRWFLVFHTRFPHRGEAHQVRVHEMFLNDDGWPVLAPYRYAGHARRDVQRSDVVGDYKLVVHEKQISAAIPASRDLQLGRDGSVSGALRGTWRVHGRNRISLELADGRKEGVLSWQWNETAQDDVPTFSVTGADGIALWGSRLPQRSTAQALQDILDDIALPASTGVDLRLPATAMRGATVRWRSADPQWLDDAGHITRPGSDQGDRVVRLVATAQLRGQSASRTLKLVVKARRSDGLVAAYRFDGDLRDSSGQRDAGTVAGELIDAPDGNITFVAGRRGRAAQFDGASSIRLPPGLIQGDHYSVAFWIRPDALSMYTPSFFAARDGDHWISMLPMGHAGVGGDSMLWSGTAWYDAGLGLKLQTGQWAHVAFSVDAGQLKVYVDGALRYSGSGFPSVFDGSDGVFSLGGNWWDSPYRGAIDELRIYETALDAAQVRQLASEG